eukprot:gene1268-726_t
MERLASTYLPSSATIHFMKCANEMAYLSNSSPFNITSFSRSRYMKRFSYMQPNNRSIDAATELIGELKALMSSGAGLAEMDERRVRAVAEDISNAYGDFRRILMNPYTNVENNPLFASACEHHRAKFLRQKRCLVAYLLWRLQQVTSAWWSAQENQLQRDLLHAAETQYLEEYDETMVEYMTSFPVPLDLHHFYVSPITNETIRICSGKQILLHFEEAEQLLKEGVVELVLAIKVLLPPSQVISVVRHYYSYLFLYQSADNYFELLRNTARKSLGLSQREWLLTCYCLDELNYRRADTAFLCGAAIPLLLRKHRTGIMRMCCTSIYAGLVSYDLTLQHANVAPAVQFWTGITTLQSDLGREARAIYTPDSYYVTPSVGGHSFFTAIGEALLLKTWISSLVTYRVWRDPSGSSGSRLTVSTRFWKWDMNGHSADNEVVFWLGSPSIQVSHTLLESYKVRDTILPHASLAAKWWYALHFRKDGEKGDEVTVLFRLRMRHIVFDYECGTSCQMSFILEIKTYIRKLGCLLLDHVEVMKPSKLSPEQITPANHLCEALALCQSIIRRYQRTSTRFSSSELKAMQDLVQLFPPDVIKPSTPSMSSHGFSLSLTPTIQNPGVLIDPLSPRLTDNLLDTISGTMHSNDCEIVSFMENCDNVAMKATSAMKIINNYIGNHVACTRVHTYRYLTNDELLLDPITGVACLIEQETPLGRSYSMQRSYMENNTLYIPLRVDGQFVGCVEAKKGIIPTDALSSFKLLLRAAAIVLRNIENTYILSWGAKKAEAMLKMSTRLARDALDEAVLIQSIMNTAKELTESDRCSMFIVKEDHSLEAHFEDGNIVNMPAGTGIAGFVARTGKVVNIPNAYEDERFNRQVDKATGYRTRTILCLPVIYEGQIVAVAQLINKLDLVTDSGLHIPRTYGRRDEELFETFSMFAAASLRNCRINDNLLKEKKKTDAILNVVTLLSNTDIRDVDGIVQHVLHGAKKLLNADRSSLFLIDKERNELYSRLADSVSGNEIRFPSGQGIAGSVAASGIGENITDAYNDPRFNSAVDKQLGYRTQSILCEPIILNGEVLAVVQLVNKLTSKDEQSDGKTLNFGAHEDDSSPGNVTAFSEADRNTFKVFSLFAGISINNSHLLEFAVNAGREAMELNELRAGNKVAGQRAKMVGITEAERRAILDITLDPSYDLGSPDFNLFTVRERAENPLDEAAAVALKVIQSTGLPEKFGCRETTLVNFILQCRKKYRFVPYHNFFHVVDVCQTMHTFLYRGRAKEFLTDLECFVLLVTALVHDLDHMGVNNSFYLKTDSPLGILSSASGNNSVLEVHHCNLAIEILSDPDSDVFEGLGPVDNILAYRALIDCVLATDMAKHASSLKAFVELVKEGFSRTNEDHRRCVMEVLLKACDVSNVTKPFEASRLWAMAVTEEFYRQGDIEKEKGVEVLPMFDRSKNNELARGQIGFIDFVAGKFFKEIVETLFHGMQWCVDNEEMSVFSSTLWFSSSFFNAFMRVHCRSVIVCISFEGGVVHISFLHIKKLIVQFFLHTRVGDTGETSISYAARASASTVYVPQHHVFSFFPPCCFLLRCSNLEGLFGCHRRHLQEALGLCEAILNRYSRARVFLSDSEVNAFRQVQQKVDTLLCPSFNFLEDISAPAAVGPKVAYSSASALLDIPRVVKIVETCLNVKLPIKDTIRAINKEASNIFGTEAHTFCLNPNDGLLVDYINGLAASLEPTTPLGKSATMTGIYTVAKSLYVPLRVGSELVGCIETSPLDMDGVDRGFLNTVMPILAIALRNAVATEQLHWGTQKSEAMLTMATRLARDALDEAVLIQSIMNTAKALTESDRCSMFIVKEDHSLEAHFEDGNIVNMPAGTGIAGFVARTGKVVNIPNAYEDERFNRQVDKATGYRTRTILCLPVIYEGQIVAVAQLINKLDLVTDSGLHIPRTYGRRDEELFETFSMFAAASLRNCRINDNLLKEKKKIDAILNCVTLLSNTDIRDVDGIVQHVLHGAKQLLNADRSTLFLFDKERNELYSRLADSVSGNEIRFPSGQGIAGSVAASGIGENITDAYNDPRFNSAVDKQLGYRTQSILCEPIILNGEVLAVVQLVNKLTSKDEQSDGKTLNFGAHEDDSSPGNVTAFSEADRNTFKVFSLFAGISINNSHLLEFAVKAGREAMELNELRAGNKVAGQRVKMVGITETERRAILDITLDPSYDLGSPDFNLFTVRERAENPLDEAAAVALKVIQSTGLPEKFGCRETTLVNFILQCRKKYRFVPYHNFFHVVDVCQTIHTFLYYGKAAQLLTELECFVLLVTALVHDLDHMGVNNSFYLKTDSPLGILSSASGNNSVLEVHHCNLAIEILSDPDSDVFEGLKGSADLTSAYRSLIDCVLATDMARHASELKEFIDTAAHFSMDNEMCRRSVMKTLLKAADVSNVTKPFEASRLWAMAVTEEFYRQGDIEKEKGVEVLPMFDRSKNNELARGQIGFIDFVAGKFFKEIVEHFFHGMQWCVDNITTNRAEWQSILDGSQRGGAQLLYDDCCMFQLWLIHCLPELCVLMKNFCFIVCKAKGGLFLLEECASMEKVFHKKIDIYIYIYRVFHCRSFIKVSKSVRSACMYYERVFDKTLPPHQCIVQHFEIIVSTPTLLPFYTCFDREAYLPLFYYYYFFSFFFHPYDSSRVALVVPGVHIEKLPMNLAKASLFDTTGNRHLLEALTLCDSILTRYKRTKMHLNEYELNACRKLQSKVEGLVSLADPADEGGEEADPVAGEAATNMLRLEALTLAQTRVHKLLQISESVINIRLPMKDTIKAINEEIGKILSTEVRTYYVNRNDHLLFDPVNGVAAPLDASTPLGKSATMSMMYTIANVLYIPLIIEKEFIGCIEAYAARVSRSDRQELDPALKLITIALRNAMDAERLSWDTQKSEAMLTMGTRLARDALDEAVLIQSIMNTAKALTESDRCSMFIVKEDHSLEAHFEDGNIVNMPAGTGIAGFVARTGKVVNIPNAYEDERFNRQVDKATGYRTRTILCLPVIYEGQIVAVAQLINKLDLVTDSGLHIPRVFGRRDEELFETFSMFAAASLRNCRINDNLLKEKKKIDAILKVVSLLSNTDIRDVDGIVQHVLHGAKQLLNADRSTLFLFDKERNELYSRLADSVSGNEIRFPSGQGIAGSVAASGIGENITDAYQDPRFNSAVDKQLGYRTQSILCEPIILNGEVLAVVQLVNKIEEDGSIGSFTQGDLETFKAFSLFAGISINNSHLLQFAVNAGREAMELNEVRTGSRSGVPKTKLLGITEAERRSILNIELDPSYDVTSPEFNLFTVREHAENPLDEAAAVALKVIQSTGLPEKFGCRETTLVNFILQCRKKYRFVPYHNFFHVVDVCQTIHTFLYHGKAAQLLTELECFVLLVTALVHDLDHMGVNNSFYLKTDSPLGILSSASGNNSVLEVHHCNLAIEILSDPDSDVFEGLSGASLTSAYRSLIDCVLATDMARHGELLKEFAQLNAAQYDINNEDHRRKAMEALIKAADVSNVTKPFEASRLWAMAVTEEFYRQGDIEKEKGVEVLPMFDRSKNNELARGQIGFIDFVAGKFFKEIVSILFQGMQWCVDNITANRGEWQAILDGLSARRTSTNV